MLQQKKIDFVLSLAELSHKYFIHNIKTHPFNQLTEKKWHWARRQKKEEKEPIKKETHKRLIHNIYRSLYSIQSLPFAFYELLNENEKGKLRANVNLWPLQQQRQTVSRVLSLIEFRFANALLNWIGRCWRGRDITIDYFRYHHGCQCRSFELSPSAR